MENRVKVKTNSKAGHEILGAAIVNPSFVTACLRKRVKLEKMLDQLAHLDEPQCALGTLRSLLEPQRWYISFKVKLPRRKPLFTSRSLTTFRDLFSGIILGTVITNNSCLELSKTNFGIRQTVDQLQTACVGSVSQSDDLLQQVIDEKKNRQINLLKTVEEQNNLEITHRGKKLVCCYSRWLNQVHEFPDLKSLIWAFIFSQMKSEPHWDIGLVFPWTLRNENARTVEMEHYTNWVIRH